MSMKGESDPMPVTAAVEMIRATPPEKRSEFAYDIWRRRKEWGADRRSEMPFRFPTLEPAQALTRLPGLTKAKERLLIEVSTAWQ